MKNMWAGALCLAAMAVVPTAAQAGILMQVTGVDGEVTLPNYQKWIEVSSFSLSITLTPPAGGMGSAKPVFSNFYVSAPGSIASVKMLQFALMGRRLDQVKVDMTQSDYQHDTEQTYAEWVLNDAFITSYKTKGSGDRPLEEYTFSYGEITYNWWKTNPDGTVSGKVTYTWNLDTGRASSLMEGNTTGFTFELGVAPVPEASSLLMLGAASAGMILRRRK